MSGPSHIVHVGQQIVFGSLPADKPLELPAGVADSFVAVGRTPREAARLFVRWADGRVEKWLLKIEGDKVVPACALRITEAEKGLAAEVNRG